MGRRRRSIRGNVIPWMSLTETPIRGNPLAEVLYGMETNHTLLTDPVSTAPHEAGRDKDRPFIRGERDPASLALEAVGAQRVSAEEIDMCTWDADAQRIVAKRPFCDQPEMFHVYRLPPRRVADGATKHGWSYGTRLGRNATGQWSNMAGGPKQPPLPPALRKVNWRELLQILQASQQVGLPCSVNTDKSLGWPLYCYQSFEILMGTCLGARNILLRALGQRSKGSEAGKKEGVAQRAKCGFCPCCSRATHVLIPATYEQGQFDRSKANAVRL